MKIHVLRLAAVLLVLMTGNMAAMAQYNPGNPPEPNIKYKVTVGVTPKEAGYASGTGSYFKGTEITVSTSAKVGYDFLYWTKNGIEYGTSMSFRYAVEDESADFVAVYRYNPTNPAEPSGHHTFRLYLDCTPADACSFNRTSGLKVESGTQVSVSATPSQGFKFIGWYEGNTLVSSKMSFSYTMKAEDCHLTARFLYTPSNPDDPTSIQTDVDNSDIMRGDVNGDGTVDASDAVMLIGYYLEDRTAELNSYVSDVNGDGVTDVSDAVEIINIYLGN